MVLAHDPLAEEYRLPQYKCFTLITVPLPPPIGCALLWASHSDTMQKSVRLSR